MTRNNRFIFIVGIMVAIISIGWFFQTKNYRNQKRNQLSRIKIITSFYPLYFFTSQIGQNNIEVENLIPAGAEPHDYELTTGDIAKIENSHLLVINGSGFEPWADKLQNDLLNKKIKVIKTAQHLTTVTDPHIWLDPVLAQQEVKIITQALIEIDPPHQSTYEKNSRALLEKLEKLHLAFKQGLQHCQQQNIITSHAAFGYLAKRYGLTQIAIQGINPDQEPSPKQLAEIADLAKKEKIRYIFFETLVSPRLADTLAREINAKTLVFNPLEGLTNVERRTGMNYFTIQKDNLNNLRIALQCQ